MCNGLLKVCFLKMYLPIEEPMFLKVKKCVLKSQSRKCLNVSYTDMTSILQVRKEVQEAKDLPRSMQLISGGARLLSHHSDF